MATDIKQLQTAINNLTSSTDNVAINNLTSSTDNVAINNLTSSTDNVAINNQTSSTDNGPSFIGSTSANPATSCSDIPREKPSGEFWIQNTKTGGSPMKVFCDMTKTCCNTTGGWTRVANIDMRDPNQTCPSGFTLIKREYPPLRTCGRHGDGFGCRRTQFQVPQENYSRVCGRVIGYQKGSSRGFSTGFSSSIIFIDGAWLTLANDNTDPDIIWSFVVARDETTNSTEYICPCTRPNLIVNSVPSVFRQDYFCDTGSREAATDVLFYDMDPLWDGQGCGGSSTCCQFNNPPWFCKQLPHSSSDDIELSMCNRAVAIEGDSPLEIIELYVH